MTAIELHLSKSTPSAAGSPASHSGIHLSRGLRCVSLYSPDDALLQTCCSVCLFCIIIARQLPQILHLGPLNHTSRRHSDPPPSPTFAAPFCSSHLHHGLDFPSLGDCRNFFRRITTTPESTRAADPFGSLHSEPRRFFCFVDCLGRAGDG